jgi:hypothetical protein
MANNYYQFSAVELITIPGIPDFERTSTFYYRGVLQTGAGTGACVLIDNLTAGNRGITIYVYGANSSKGNKVAVSIRNSSTNKIDVETTSAVMSDSEFRELEIWYDGSSTASGITIHVGGVNKTITTNTDTLTATTLTGANGYTTGKFKNLAATANAWVLDEYQFTIDSTKEFETKCDDKGLTVNDLSTQNNDGTITLNGSATFYRTSYGEKYRFYFYWDHDDNNNYYKVSILENDYFSTVSDLKVGAAPWVVSIDGQLDTIANPVMGSAVNFNIIADGSEYTTYDADFLEAEYKDFIVKLIEDPDGTPLTKWVGFLMPANATRDYLGDKKIYNLSAVDGLADLKNKKYSSNGEDTGSPYTGFDNMLSVMKKALGKVADISELQLDFRIQLGTYSDQMTASENALKESEIAQELFSEEKDNVTSYNSCYEVIQKILAPFYCSIMQDDGYYWIINHGERNTVYYEFDWATLTQQSRTTWSNKRIDASAYKWYGKGTLYKTSPFKDFNVKLYNKKYIPELITNGGFANGSTGWANGDADNSSNTWTDVNAATVEIGDVLSAEYTGVAQAASYHVHTTSSFVLTVGGGSQLVNATIKLYLVSTSPGGISDLKVRLRLWNSTNNYLTGTSGYQTILQEGTLLTFTDQFNVTSFTVATNYLDVEIQAPDSNTTDIAIDFDNVSLKQDTAEAPVDWNYNGKRSTGSQTKSNEQIIYIAEQQESSNDLCAVKDSGGSYVTSWNRYGLTTEDRPLIVILQQLVYNSNRGYMSYIKGTIRDENQTINAFNSLLLNDGDFRIIGLEKDYREGVITLDLVEVVYTGLLLESDTTFTNSIVKTTSQYGQSVE